MIIVAGHLLVRPEDRARFVDGSLPAVRAARQTPGCQDFAVAADPVDPSRVNVYEEWTSEEALQAFRAGGPEDDLGSLVLEYRISQRTL